MDEKSLIALGRRIRSLREGAGLTQIDLAYATQAVLHRDWASQGRGGRRDRPSRPPSIGHTYISRIENGKLPHSLSTPTLLAIAEVVGADLTARHELLWLAGKPPEDFLEVMGASPEGRELARAIVETDAQPPTLKAATKVVRKASERKASHEESKS